MSPGGAWPLPPPKPPPCVTHLEGVRVVFEKPIGVGGMGSTCWGQSALVVMMRFRGKLIRSSSKEPHDEAKMHSIEFITDRGYIHLILQALYSLFIMYTKEEK